jgi:hypothetical protein
MIYLLTFVGIAISLVLWRHLHELNDRSSITRTTISGALEFLATFSAVGVFYSALQLWINSSAFDPSDYVSIRQMELNIVNIRHALLPVLDLNKRIELVVPQRVSRELRSENCPALLGLFKQPHVARPSGLTLLYFRCRLPPGFL